MGVPSQSGKEDGLEKGPSSSSRRLQTATPGPAAGCVFLHLLHRLNTGDSCFIRWPSSKFRFPLETLVAQASAPGTSQRAKPEVLCERGSEKPWFERIEESASFLQSDVWSSFC